MTEYRFEKMTMGTCYYPEHWDRALWEEDLIRMKKVGISVIRIAEFSWSFIEPREGEFTFDFYDDFLELCNKNEMQVVFGTPSATPPAWLTEKYPEILNCDKNGIPYRHGGRRHYNYNSPKYRELVARIVGVEAEHFGRHPAIIGWQIDNELNCETAEFYSEADSVAFRQFLKEKYVTLEALNTAWGTVFWNETYTDWSEIFVPRPVINQAINPHQHLDYIRFISKSALDFCELQAKIIREYKKDGDFVTTNGLFANMDNHKLMDDSLNIYMYDSYPNFAYGLDRDPITSDDLNDRKWSKNLTEVRSVCPHFAIMEQQSGANGWTTRMEAPSPRPGQLRLWAMQSVAHGADMVSFFRWRTCTFGTEMYWHGILDYDNRDNRKLKEVSDFYNDLRKLDKICGAGHISAFALIKDYDNEWDATVDNWHSRVSRASESEIFKASQLLHTPYDVVYINDESPADILSDFPVAIYPHPVIMSERRAALLSEYVKNGGTLIIGCRSGYKDMNGKCVMLPQPGLLQKLTGSDVRDFSFASPAEETIRAHFVDGGAEIADMPVFNDVLEPTEGGRVIAIYLNGYFEGRPCAIEKETGKGKAIHLGSTFSAKNLGWLFSYTGIAKPFGDVIDAPSEVEIVARQNGAERYYFVLNYTNSPVTYILRDKMYELLSEAECDGEQTLPAYGVAVYSRI